ncbi:MAG: CBS domain-containing protein [Flammeovirgaceae bacterium]|nr:CBS domain-containing protein [Flammeovirgaceae bacterium]
MGSKGVRIAKTQEELNSFTKNLLSDVKALEQMLEEEWFEVDEMKIGAEQEVCLVNDSFKPAPMAMEILKKLNHDNFTTELAKFNIEANLSPIPLKGNCFSALHAETQLLIDLLTKTTKEFDITPVLTGILPTIRKFDLEIENLTPIDRYYALIEAIETLRGIYELKIEGIDELNIKHKSALLEACNTSFQVHLQVKPDEFVDKYNIAQVVAAPVLAISSNSPILFGKRLWNETRIALFQQSVDTRVTGEHLRYTSPRVTFGNSWLKNSILDLYREDIVRFKILLMADINEDVFECLANKKTPKLTALNIHNSTVYRWNRPCYGVSPNGKPHLRIENRILPAGPSVVDEIANSAFWIGLMTGFEDAYKNITQRMDFGEAKSNFLKAARSGLGSKFYWVDQRIITDTELIEKELLPIARDGLKKYNVHKNDIDKYLDIIQARNEKSRTGARWTLESYAKLIKTNSREEVSTALVAAMVKNQIEQKPIHELGLANIEDIIEWAPSHFLVEEFMTTDLFTVNKDDIPELSADMMDWQQLRYLPIENDKGELIGLVTHRELLRYFSNNNKSNNCKPKRLGEIMLKNPITIRPEQTIVEAMDIMMEHKIGCLPVINNGKLVGLITETNFLNITASLFKRLKRGKQTKKR